MIALSVKADVSRIARQVGLFGRDMERATASALNKAVAKGRTQMAAEIGAEYNLRPSRIKQRLAIRRAYASGRIRLSAELIGTGKRAMNVIAFVQGQRRPKRTKKGTAAQLKFLIARAKGQKQIQGAFVGNQGRTVFKRTGPKRLPIVPVQTIDVPQMFNQRRINQIVRDVMINDFANILEHEARYFAGRL